MVFRGARVILLLAPLFLALVWRETWTARSHPVVSVFDPSWSYLSNALLVAEGRPTFHVDHPGTPLHILGALLLRVLHPLWHPGTELAESVFTHPERYLTALAFAEFLLALAFVFAASYLFLRAGRSLVVVLFSSFLFLSFPESRDVAVFFKPDFLAGAVGFFTLSLVALDRKEAWVPYAVGAAIGFGAALKLYLVPYVLLAFLYPGWWRVLLVASATFLLWTLPAWPEYGHLGKFLFKIATTDGNYGGRPEILDLARMKGTLTQLFTLAPHLLVMVPLSLFAALSARNRASLFAAALVLASLALLAKHPSNHDAPATRYLMPCLAAIAAMLPLALGAFRGKLPRLALCGAFLAAFLFVNREYYELQHVPARLRAVFEPAGRASFAEGLFRKYPDCSWIIGSFPPVKLAGIDFASRWAGNAYIPLLSKLYPTRRVFNAIPGGLFSYYGMRKSYDDVKEEVRSGTCYLFLTTATSPRPYFDASHWLEFRDITQENREHLDWAGTMCEECRVLKVRPSRGKTKSN